jgi:hypothetical protein
MSPRKKPTHTQKNTKTKKNTKKNNSKQPLAKGCNLLMSVFFHWLIDWTTCIAHKYQFYRMPLPLGRFSGLFSEGVKS